jgi:prephenate dehydrogenase
MAMFEKITVLGVGLIGASFALGMKQKGLCRHISGFGRNRENLEKAKARGIIDSFETAPDNACLGSDLILLSTPVGSFIDLAKSSSSSFKKGAIVTDTGSVKGGLVAELEKIMPPGVHFIGGHPIAGSDKSGIESAGGGLFLNAKCILTPTRCSNGAALKKVSDLWAALGAKVVTMEPAEHDRIYAAVSHLPHVISYSLVNAIAGIDPSYFEFSGRGFRDMTRIAGSSPELWRDICMLNRENLIEMIAVFRQNLDSLSRYLRTSDGDSLEREFGKARTLREGIGQN